MESLRARMGPFQLETPCRATESGHRDPETHPFEGSPHMAGTQPLNHRLADTPNNLADCGAGVTERHGTPTKRPATRAGCPGPSPSRGPRLGVPALGGRGHHSCQLVQGAISQCELLGSTGLAQVLVHRARRHRGLRRRPWPRGGTSGPGSAREHRSPCF